MTNKKIYKTIEALKEITETDFSSKYKGIIELSNTFSSKLKTLNESIDNPNYLKIIEVLKDSLNLYEKYNNIYYINKFKNFEYNDLLNKVELYYNSLDKINNRLISASKFYDKSFEGDILKNKLLSDSLNENIIVKNKFEEKFDVNFSDELKESYQIFYKYILYAYKNNECSIVEEYDKSIINNIHDLGLNINDLIHKINGIYSNKKGFPFFDLKQSLVDMVGNITRYATNEIAFSELMNLLYKGFIECCGNDKNRIYIDYEKFGKNVLDLIKDVRGYFVHEETIVEKRVVNTYMFFQKVLDVNVPVKESDFLKLQCELYKRIEVMLKCIFDDMNINL